MREKKLSIVFLDTATLDGGDISFDTFTPRWKCEFHQSTTPDNLLERISGMDVAVTNKVVFDAAALNSQEASNLKLIAIAATGTNNVDLKSASEKDITVCNVAGYSTNSVVQHTFALLFELASHPGAYAEDVRNGNWERSPIFTMFNRPLVELHGKTMGIIGFGSIGKAVAAAAAGFGMKILVSARPGSDDPTPEGRVPFEQLIRESDVVSLHCPLTPQTKDLIGTHEFSIMKKSSFLINVARGGVVNEEALVNALKNGEIAGAGIDVITQEPPAENHIMTSAARELSNLVITPHNAWASREARMRLIAEVALNIEAFEKGEKRNPVV